MCEVVKKQNALYKQHYGEEVRDASSEYEEVPDAVVELFIIFQEEIAADSIEGTTRHEEEECLE